MGKAGWVIGPAGIEEMGVRRAWTNSGMGGPGVGVAGGGGGEACLNWW